jgi:uncharacterized OB-fold protein
MSTYYDDNFGSYEINDESDVEFYKLVQRESVTKQCKKCGRTVKLRPDYGTCNACMERLERGDDF